MFRIETTFSFDYIVGEREQVRRDLMPRIHLMGLNLVPPG
jgi:hypothetical protein